ncbi:vacuolar amino acid transporter, partial [Thraustotheca clavata]
MNVENEVEGRRRLNSDPGRLEVAKSTALPGVEYEEATDFRKQHHISGATPRVSAHVRANVIETLSTIYNPFVAAIMSMNDASFEDLDVVERIEHLLEISKEEEAAPLVDAAEIKGASLGHAFLSLLQAFVGTGILFLPQGFQQAGFVVAPIMLTITTLINVFCMFRLLACRELVGGSYSHIGQEAIGISGRRLVQTSLFLMQTGFCCSYVIFVALNLHDVFVYYGIEISVRMIIALQTLFYIPLSWIRYLRNLIGNIFVLYAIFYILYINGALLIDLGVKESIINVNERDYTIFIGTAVFVFEGVGLIIPTQASLSPSLQPRFKWLLLQVIIGLIIFFSLFAWINYAAIGNKVEPMILSNLPRTPPTMWVQAGYAFAQTLAFPLFLFPAIQIIEDILGFPRRSSGLKCCKNLVRCFLVLLTAVIADAGKAHLD